MAIVSIYLIFVTVGVTVDEMSCGIWNA